jgi:hypothetical protein
VGRREIELHRVLRDPVGVLRPRLHLLRHGRLAGAVDGDGGREDEALRLVAHRFVDEVHARLEVRAVVVGADEVGETLSGVGGQVIDEVEAPPAPQRAHEVRVAHVALDPFGPGRNVLAEATREVVDGDHLHAELEAAVYRV